MRNLHRLHDDLYLVLGRPSVALYRSGSRLFLLDTGRGPYTRAGIREAASRLGVTTTPLEVVLLNSRRTADRCGNDDVAAELDPSRPLGERRSEVVRDIQIGDTQWEGRTFSGGDGRRDLQELHLETDGVPGSVFYLPRLRTVLVGDLAADPFLEVSSPLEIEGARQVLRRLLDLLDTGEVDRVCGQGAGMELGLTGDDARAALVTLVRQAAGVRQRASGS